MITDFILFWIASIIENIKIKIKVTQNAKVYFIQNSKM